MMSAAENMFKTSHYVYNAPSLGAKKSSIGTLNLRYQ